MSSQAGQVRQIASAAGVVGMATLLSRVLGFVRDMAIAWLFGAGMLADAFFVAFRIPSTLRELLGEGALSAAFVPAFTRTATRDGRQAAWDLASVVMGTLVVVLAAVSLLGVLFAPAIVWALAPGPGFSDIPGKIALTTQLLRIMFPYIFLIGLAALFMAILNSLGHFLTPALSPTVLNVAIIVAALGIAPGASNPVLPLAIAVLVGGAGQLLIQVPAAVARGWRPRLRVAPDDPRVQEIARLMAPGVGGLAITQINFFVGTFLASFLAEGSVAPHLWFPPRPVSHRGGGGGHRHGCLARHGGLIRQRKRGGDEGSPAGQLAPGPIPDPSRDGGAHRLPASDYARPV
jgi:putative peptidoglycan lipid II flippase